MLMRTRKVSRFTAVIALLIPTLACAQQTPLAPGDVSGIADSMFDSPVFRAMVQRLKTQSAGVVNGIDGSVLARVKAALPKSADLAQLKYGTHNVVTNGGEQVVSWIIEAAHDDPKTRAPLLAKLAQLADRRLPEALTFEGFLSEYGIWGVPQSLQRAIQFYQAAAAMNYQPAVYNMALAAAYGRGGAIDVNNATALISEAYAIAPDGSGRVCGFGAFLSYRQGDRDQALRYTKSCGSDLADIAKALYDPQVVPSQRVELLRSSIATGVNDGYALLERQAGSIRPDPQFLACKYSLVNKYRVSLVGNRLHDDALACFQQSDGNAGDKRQALIRMNTVVPGIIGFVPVEIRALEKLRQSNHFHYAWSVPYLPFRQDDADLFEAYVAHTKN